MVKPTSPEVTPAKKAQGDLDTGTLINRLPHLAAEKKAEEEKEQPRSYASPPCYLAEFTAAEGTDHTAK